MVIRSAVFLFYARLFVNMVLESPSDLAEFFMERYKQSRERYGNVLKKPVDVYDMDFTSFIADHAQDIHSIATGLKTAYPHVSEEDHALMAYLLNLLTHRIPLNAAPHTRIIRAPRRFFIAYVRKAFGESVFNSLAERYKHAGIPVSEILNNVPGLMLPEHVLKRRFYLR